MQTERVTILMSAAEKAALATRARARSMSVGHYVRSKVAEDEELTPEQEAELGELVRQANIAIPQMAASLDAMIDTVRATREHLQRTLDELSTRA